LREQTGKTYREVYAKTPAKKRIGAEGLDFGKKGGSIIFARLNYDRGLLGGGFPVIYIWDRLAEKVL